MSNNGIQHLKQNPLATLKNPSEHLLAECRPKHLKHMLNTEGHPPVWITFFFAIAEHTKQQVG
jgi:hypothetical protein